MTSIKEPDFEHIAACLGGMLSPSVYRSYYRLARDEAQGSIIELGTGQGASTIAFALGVRNSGRCARIVAVDQFYQVSRGPHPASIHEHGDGAVEINEAAFRENLNRFGVSDLVDLRVGKTVDVELNAASDGPFDVLAIDVDGMIDRDLAHYYDLIEPSGWLVIDDCRNAVNWHGRRNLEAFRALSREDAVERLRGLSSFERRRILGKHVLTYRLVRKLTSKGLIAVKRRQGSTIFCQKIGSDHFAECFSPEDARLVEESIVRDFEHLMRTGRTELTLWRTWGRYLKRLSARSLKRVGHG